MKLCKDCLFFEAHHNPEHLDLSKCKRPAKWKAVNVITGESGKLKYTYCETQRLLRGIFFNYLLDCCGKRGIFFKPREQ